MRRTARAPAGALLVSILALAACAAPARPPNLLLVSVDTLRPDHLGCYGDPRGASPRIDRLARESVLFERAYSTTNWTLPAHLSMLTGLYPAEHGVRDEYRGLDPRVPTLAEELRRRGYATAGVVSTVALMKRHHGFARGFDDYDDRTAYTAKDDEADRYVSSPVVVRRGLELLDQMRGEGERPFFLFLHLFDAHAPYEPPAELAAPFLATGPRPHTDPALAEEEARYDGEIRFVDGWVGRLLDELERRGLLATTLVALTADHGEEFGEHGQRHHRLNLFETSVRVPLLVRYPDGSGAGRRVATPVSLVDLPATLLAAAGSGEERFASGIDLGGFVSDSSGPPLARDLWLENRHRRGRTTLALVAGGRKAIFVEREERAGAAGEPVGLFDLAADPFEQHDLAAARPAELETLRTRLEAGWSGFERVLALHPPRSVRHARQAALANLKALGYL